MNQQSWTYLSQLTRALQNEGVDGARAGEFVAEVDSHLAETGADPVEEFGRPFELAAELARRPGSRRPGWLPPIWAMWLAGLVLSLALVVVIDAVMVGWDGAGVPIRARGIFYIGVFFPAMMVLNYASTRLLTGRTWNDLVDGRVLLAILGIAIATTTASTIAGDRVIARVPAPVFWCVAIEVVAVFGYIVVKRNNTIRFPDHASHLRRLRRGPLAGRPPAEAPR